MDEAARRLARAVTDVAQRSLPQSRHDTPSPGWESSVWVRIQRRRRYRRLGALVLALAAGGGGALVARHHVLGASATVRVTAALESPLRADGSTPLHARWQVAYDGAELRVYRNALGAVVRCPGSAECTVTAGGGAMSLMLDVPGEYRAVTFSRPASARSSTMQEDLAAARARGDRVEISGSVVVY